MASPTKASKNCLTQRRKGAEKPDPILCAFAPPRETPPNSHHSAFGIRHSAFTLVELLVVIGIILVLIGLFFAGAKMVTGDAKKHDTQTALETCKSMFENYRSATHLSRLPPAGFSTSNLSGSITAASVIPPPTQFWSAGQEPAPGVLSSDPSAYTSNIPAVLNTVLVMYALETLPENQKIIANLPASKIINIPAKIGLSNVTVPLIRDGWGNPILFVPGGGLGANAAGPGALWLDGASWGIVTSNGVITNNSTPTPATTYDAANPTQFPTGSQTQPFFVSAGPDGDVSNAHGNTSGKPTSDMTDDNIYSFQN